MPSNNIQRDRIFFIQDASRSVAKWMNGEITAETAMLAISTVLGEKITNQDDLSMEYRHRVIKLVIRE